APQKRGRPKRSRTDLKANTIGTGKQKNNAKAANKTASGVEDSIKAANGKVGKTDGLKKRGRPKKSVVDLDGSVVTRAEKETTKKPAELRKRGRPKKGT
ncbi:MAG: hypothetical protein LQ346_006028, partial [Caloplaca aetnensis]